MKIRKIIIISIGIVIGYILALCTFRKEVWIDTNSGNVKEKISLFPLAYEDVRNDRAFPFLFGVGDNGRKKDWILCSRKNLLLSATGFTGYSKGDKLLAHQRTFLAAFQATDFRHQERSEIAKTYFDLIESGNSARASEYSMEVWQKSADRVNPRAN